MRDDLGVVMETLGRFLFLSFRFPPSPLLMVISHWITKSYSKPVMTGDDRNPSLFVLPSLTLIHVPWLVVQSVFGCASSLQWILGGYLYPVVTTHPPSNPHSSTEESYPLYINKIKSSKRSPALRVAKSKVKPNFFFKDSFDFWFPKDYLEVLSSSSFCLLGILFQTLLIWNLTFIF